MIFYKKCSEVDIDSVFEAFNRGFEDYIIKIEIPKEFFIKRFFGPEGNRLELSYIALDNDTPIAIVLGGIKEYEGIKTMRCGGLAVKKEYRKLGIAKELMRLHKEEAKTADCKQLLLEVIVGNDKAIDFYKSLKYQVVYNLSYHTLNDLDRIRVNDTMNLEIKPMYTEGLKIIREKILDVHINWQNDVEYLELSEDQLTLAACFENNLAGVISMNKNSKISFIWVNNVYRHKGVAKQLILGGAKRLKLSKVSIGFPNSSSLHGFVNSIGFTKDNIEQYEMYLTI